ncbi:adipocyte plasma membrane-associated protein-like [Montipora capricornis]|uniref:adipocyte plasma membrane-associated protein-like n=1 Tax=Montipora capricornis TaxID=246305 RepID=UPI0035F1A57C
MGVSAMCVTLLFLVLSFFDVLLFFLPSPIDPKPFSFQQMPKFEGALEINNNLTKTKRLFEGQLVGPESFAVDSTGILYSGLADGRIVKLEDNKVIDVVQTGKPPCGTPELEPTCGRPLGMRFDRYGINLIVADAYFGLLEVNTRARTVNTLVPPSPGVNGKPFRFVNDLDIGRDGTVYFTDSSTKWQRQQVAYAVFEQEASGRLMAYHPKTGDLEVLLEGLYFANGVQLSPEGDHLLVAETTSARIIKYYIKGEHEGKWEVFAQNLPGLPDNIRLSNRGGYWVGLAMSRTEIIDLLAKYPRAKNFLLKVFSLPWLTSFFIGQRHNLLLEVDENGQIIRSLHDPTSSIVPDISEVHDEGDELWFGSYNSKFIGWLDLKE